MATVLVPERPQPAAWITSRGVPLTSPIFHVRVRSGDPLAFQTPRRAAIRALDPDLALYDTRSLAQHIDNNLFLQRAPTQLLSVLAYAVAQRTQEIGVRLTLGATPHGVVLQIMREGLVVVALGTAAGWLIALTLGWYLRPKLVGVPVGDPLIYVGAPALLLACYLPARHATRISPLTALRTE